MVQGLTEDPAPHLVLPDEAYTRADDSILVYRDGLSMFLHRRLYNRLHPEAPIPRGLYLVPDCDEPRCQNPHHRKIVTRPAQTMAPGSIPWQEKNRMFCLRAGHPLAGENLYTHTDKRGYTHRECRACKLELGAERRRLARESRQKETS